MTNFTTVAIGTLRDDGEFAILATLNNTDEYLPHDQFHDIVRNLARSLAAATGEPVRGYERQDTPDYIDLDGSERLVVESVDDGEQP